MTDKLVNVLKKHLDWEVSEHFVRANNAMWRELEYLRTKKPQLVGRAREHGWSTGQLRAVGTLNAFNRVVLGPLAATVRRSGNAKLGRTQSIQYGELITINNKTTASIEAMLLEFESICSRARIKQKWLFVNRMNDIIFLLDRDAGVEQIDDD